MVTLAGQFAITPGLVLALGEGDGLASEVGETLAIEKALGADGVPAPGTAAWLPQAVEASANRATDMVGSTRLMAL